MVPRASIPLLLAVLLIATALPARAVDYPGAAWYPASTSNYTSSNRETTYDITYVVIHVAEGSYNATISWFQNPSAQVSAHYVVAQDGRVAQMVLGKDIAWHAGNWEYNKHSIGIEHEGYTADPSTWTDAMYAASAKLTRFLADSYGIALVHPTGIMPENATTQTGIIGHNQVPDPNDPTKGGGINHHTDPGAYFDWDYYMSLVRGDGNAFAVHLVAPAANAWVRGTVTADGTTNEDGSLAWARFLLDGAVQKWATAAPHLWTFDSASLADGAHTLTFEAKDGAGNYASATIRMPVDNTPPVAALTSPKAGTINVNGDAAPDPFGLTIAVGDVPVQATATDAMSGMSRVVFTVDGTPRATDASAPYAWTWRTQDESLGGHTLGIVAYDVAGNTRVVTMRVDLTAPASPAGLQATLLRLAP